MPADLFRVIVPVPDVAKAARFYAALLDDAGEAVAGGTRHYFTCGSTILALANPGERGTDFRPNVDHVYFAVEDLEATRKRAQGVDALDLDDIAVRPWGERSFYFKDPFGNPLCFVDEATVLTGES